MQNWNSAFTQMIRPTRRAHWGNWGLNPAVRPGAVGMVDPATGEFTYASTLPNAKGSTKPVSSKWQLATSSVTTKSVTGSLDVSGKDPDTGSDIKAGLKMSWNMSHVGDMVSWFRVINEEWLDQWPTAIHDNMDWLAREAEQVGMGQGGQISQGFGVITSVIWCDSGLNIGSLADSNSFTLEGSASSVNAMVGSSASGKGSYTSATATKAVDQHVWPPEPNSQADTPVPIAFTFASVNGRMIMPLWIQPIGAFELVLDNANGGTYIVDSLLSYNIPSQRERIYRSKRTTGGLMGSIGDIPLDASNLVLDCTFLCVGPNETHSFVWPTPLGTWTSGTRHIDLTGVWPGRTGAVDVEASRAA